MNRGVTTNVPAPPDALWFPTCSRRSCVGLQADGSQPADSTPGSLSLRTRLFPLRDSAAPIHIALCLVLGKSSLRCTKIFSIPAVCLAAACRVMGGSELTPWEGERCYTEDVQKTSNCTSLFLGKLLEADSRAEGPPPPPGTARGTGVRRTPNPTENNGGGKTYKKLM